METTTMGLGFRGLDLFPHFPNKNPSSHTSIMGIFRGSGFTKAPLISLGGKDRTPDPNP